MGKAMERGGNGRVAGGGLSFQAQSWKSFPVLAVA